MANFQGLVLACIKPKVRNIIISDHLCQVHKARSRRRVQPPDQHFCQNLQLKHRSVYGKSPNSQNSQKKMMSLLQVAQTLTSHVTVDIWWNAEAKIIRQVTERVLARTLLAMARRVIVGVEFRSVRLGSRCHQLLPPGFRKSAKISFPFESQTLICWPVPQRTVGCVRSAACSPTSTA